MATQSHLNSLQGTGCAFILPGIDAPVCYGKVAAAQVEQQTGNKTFCFSVNGIETESQFTDRGPHRPLWVSTIPNDYTTLRDKQRKNNTFEYKPCKYLLLLKSYN